MYFEICVSKIDLKCKEILSKKKSKDEEVSFSEEEKELLDVMNYFVSRILPVLVKNVIRRT